MTSSAGASGTGTWVPWSENARPTKPGPNAPPDPSFAPALSSALSSPRQSATRPAVGGVHPAGTTGGGGPAAVAVAGASSAIRTTAAKVFMRRSSVRHGHTATGSTLGFTLAT